MQHFDYIQIIKRAWQEFDSRHEIRGVYDVSAYVSTNQVYKISFYKREPVFAKLSDYGRFEDFREDHIIINNLANNLEEPYQMFLAQSLVKKNELFTYLFHQENSSAWVVFYNPIQFKTKLPARLDEKLIRKLGRELARFHKACTNVSNQLPNASKTVITDIHNLVKSVNKNEIKMCENHKSMVLKHADLFLNNAYKANYTEDFETIPVFIDWNIGNFSVTPEGRFYSRWDYDWFRMSSRVMFLKEYHRIFPLTEPEVHFIIEAYRFFILNYVIKDGPYFFRQTYSNKLIKEAYDTYFPAIDANYNVEKILKALKL